jgi:membrane protein DedA with SNARE-associated domain
MEHLSITFLKNFVEAHDVIAYFIVILGVVLEGEIAVILAGIFSHLGSLNPFMAWGSVVVGGIIKSVLGYLIGFYLTKHSEKPMLCSIERRISYFLPKFEEKPFFSIFISRFFILGIGWFTLIFSGFKRIPLKIYIKAEILSLLVWSVVVLFLGYTFSYTALSVSRDVRNFLAIILICFIIFFIFEKIVAFLAEVIEKKL